MSIKETWCAQCDDWFDSFSMGTHVHYAERERMGTHNNPTRYAREERRRGETIDYPKLESVTSEGKKDDSGKLRFDLLPALALEDLARIYTYGAEKYADRNWEKGIKWSRVFAAMMRHAWAFWRGETFDPESKMHHMAHVAWGAFTLLEYMRIRSEFDDRPTRDPLERPPTELLDRVAKERGKTDRAATMMICPHCAGRGVFAGDDTCNRCHGTGEVKMETQPASPTKCPRCGEGKDGLFTGTVCGSCDYPKPLSSVGDKASWFTCDLCGATERHAPFSVHRCPGKRQTAYEKEMRQLTSTVMHENRCRKCGKYVCTCRKD